MPKVALNKEDFKTLASETRMNIIKTLDGKKFSLNQISSNTKLSKMTLHEHLAKLIESGFVKRIEREGHKWVYYQLSWKGKSLIHPENTKVVILFSMTFFTLIGSIIGIINILNNFTKYQNIAPITRHKPVPPLKPSEGLIFGSEPILIALTIICLVSMFIILLFLIKIYKRNNKRKKN